MRLTLPGLLLCICPIASNAQSLVTAEIFHGNDAQSTASVTTDFDNNMLCFTGFWDDLDADPGPGVLNFNSVGSQDIAITKLDPSGNLIWSKQIGGAGFAAAQVIKTDAAGNVFVFGYFNGTMDMNPGPGTSNLVSNGGDDVYCAKYNQDGNLVWAANIGGTGTEQSYGFDLDAAGNPIVLGYFQNTVDFDPGVGTVNMTAGFSGSNFLLRLNTDGSYNNVIQMSSAYGNYLYVDNSDNIYLTGLFWGTVDFNPGPAVYNLIAAGFSSDAFIVKLNSAFIFQWAGIISGNSSEQGTTISVDENANAVIVAGFFEGTIDINPEPAVVNIATVDYVDAFIVRLDATDGGFIWGKSIGGTGFQAIYGVGVNSLGSIWLAGNFSNTIDCDPGPGTASLTSGGSQDIMKVNWDADANYIDAEKIGGTNSDYASCLHIDNEGAVIISGVFEGLVDFDPGDVTFNLNSGVTGWDGYVAKYCTVYTINNIINICEGESYFAEGANQTESGIYYDYYTPVEGCDSIIITHLTVGNPTVDLGANYAICNGTTTTLNAGNPGATYLWNTGATTQTINVSTTGTYSVTVTDPSGCVGADAITITVNPAPNVNLGADMNACNGETILLNAGNPGATYLWSNGATTQTINVTETGTYSVVVTNGFTCTDNDVINVTFHPSPIIELGSTIQLCEEETVVLDAENAGATYLWNTGATTQTISVNTAATYSVVVTTAFGCDASDAVVVNVVANPVVDLGDDLTVCSDAIITLDANNPGATYNWNTGATTQTIAVTESGTYGVIVTNGFGCAKSDFVSITIHPTPIIDLGTTIDFCENTTITLDAENTGSSYLWNTGAVTQTITTAIPGTYSVTVTSDEGCIATDEVIINALPAPAINLGVDTGFCDGTDLLLDATTPDVSYLWNTGAETSSIVIDEAGIYTVSITNYFGCVAADEIVIEIYATPIVDLGDDGTYCMDEEIVLDASNPDCNYVWNTGDTLATINVTTSGVYSVIVTNANGCNAYDEITISFLPLPIASLGDDIISCSNEPVILDATTPLCTYLWNTGATTATIEVSISGLYFVHITNSFGCSITDSIQVDFLPAPDVNLSLPFTTICNNVAPVELSGGTPLGGNYFGEGVVDGLFSPAGLTPDTYEIHYVYVDAIGCSDTATQTITVTICQNIQLSTLSEVLLFPNPALYSTTILNNSSTPITEFVIYDLHGHKVLTSQLNLLPEQTYILNIADFPSGTYLIQYNNNQYQTLIIQH
jgi:hypothetical protein